jgi:hypothetical protein
LDAALFIIMEGYDETFNCQAEFLHYILNDFVLHVVCVVFGVLQQPVCKLLTCVGVAGKTLFFRVP